MRKFLRKRLGLTLAIAFATIGANRRLAIVQTATLIPAFKGGIRADAVLKDPQAIIPISSACYAALAHNNVNSPDPAKACIIAKLKATGASAQAIAFADYAPVPSAIEYYYQYENAAAVYAVMRWADGASGWCLIGKSGEAIGMWEPARVESDPRFAAFARAHTDASLWMPVNRNDAPAVIALAGGAQRLIMPFTVKTCHACAIIGNARVGFDFDRSGHYQGAHLVNIEPAPFASQ